MAQSMGVRTQGDNDVPNILVSTQSLVLHELPRTNLKQVSLNNSAGHEVTNDREEVDIVRVIGFPPTSQMCRLYAKSAVVEKMSESAVILPSVPAYYWSFGCAPTSAAMIAGYYDNIGYPNMYTGPTHNGVMPMTNAEWGLADINGESWGLCPLSATRKGLDGRETYGHIDDYWIKSYSFDKDPYLIQGREPHADADCVADFMKSNQSRYSNPDGATNFQFGPEGRPYFGNDNSDGGLGLQMFFESRGYSVVKRYNQYIHEYKKYVGNNQGFTFGQYVDEINAGRPVLIHFDSHTTVGVGYELPDSTIYIHDTWDYLTHQMKWGGTYYGLTHQGVTVIQLAPSNTILVKNGGNNNLIIESISINKEWLSVSEKHTYPLIVAPGESKELSVVNNWDLLDDEEQWLA